jgi:superfamily II DNA/RNA helicase
VDSFVSLGISTAISEALEALGYSQATDVQSKAIPVVLSGADALLCSATGTGKTLAYISPIMQVLAAGQKRQYCVVICPTHELAVQIRKVFDKLSASARLPFSSALAVGSVSLPRIRESLRCKPACVVGTPGRLLHLFEQNYLHSEGLAFVVLDEADRLFENESIETTKALLSFIPPECSRTLVSATLPSRTLERAAEWLRNPEKIDLDNSLALKENIEHWAFHRIRRKKVEFVRSFEAAVRPTRCLVFLSHNANVFAFSQKMAHHGLPVAALGAKADKTERRNALEAFRSGKARYLVTSELGARGLDIENVDYVVNADFPEESSTYIHRAGRTGRAGKRGVSIIIADMIELKRASKTAVRYGFSFRCKALAQGKISDIDTESFFREAESDERRVVKTRS